MQRVLFCFSCFVLSSVLFVLLSGEMKRCLVSFETSLFSFSVPWSKDMACFLECLLLQIAYRSKTSGETCHSFPVKCVLWFSFLCENEQRSKDAKDFVSLSCFVFLSREMKTCMPEVFFGMGLFSFSVSWSKSKVSFKFSVNSKFIFLKI